ncbi:hypothetical protein FF2_022640 [Malus domestica]
MCFNEVAALSIDAQRVLSARFGGMRVRACPLCFTPIPSSMLVLDTSTLIGAEHSYPIFLITSMAKQERTSLGFSIDSETLKLIVSPPNSIVKAPLATSIMVWAVFMKGRPNKIGNGGEWAESSMSST